VSASRREWTGAVGKSIREHQISRPQTTELRSREHREREKYKQDKQDAKTVFSIEVQIKLLYMVIVLPSSDY
jgi:uncharacterized membrane protein